MIYNLFNVHLYRVRKDGWTGVEYISIFYIRSLMLRFIRNVKTAMLFDSGGFSGDVAMVTFLTVSYKNRYKSAIALA